MQQVRTAFSKKGITPFYETLKYHLDGFTTLPVTVQHILEDFFTYEISRSESVRWNGVKVDVGFFDDISGDREPVFSSFCPDVSSVNLLNFLLPHGDAENRKVVEHTAKVLAGQGCSVISTGACMSEKVQEPILFKLTLSDVLPPAFKLDSSSYQAFIVYTENSLACAEFFRKVNELGMNRYVSVLKHYYDYAWLLSLANLNGYRIDADMDKYQSAFKENALLLVIKENDKKLLALLKEYEHFPFGRIEEQTDNHTFIFNGEKVSVSSLLFDSLQVNAAGFQKNEMVDADLSHSLSPTLNSYYATISELLNDFRITSYHYLTPFFDSSTGTYKSNVEYTPYFSYISFSGYGRFLVSSELYVWGETVCSAYECAMRILYEHQLYNGTPVEVVIKIAEQEKISDAASAAIGNIARAFDILGGNLRIEREVVGIIQTDFILSVSVISSVKTNISKFLGVDVEKGDLIYLIDFRGMHRKESEETVLNTLYETEEPVKQLLHLQDVKALFPVSKGGLFFSLYSAGEKSNLGFDITSDDDKHIAEFLFSERLGRAVVVVEDGNQDVIVEKMREFGAGITLLGHFTKGEIRIDDESQGFIADLKKNVSFAFQNNNLKMASTKIVKPYGEEGGSKKKQVAEMFDNIAHKYDFLNHFLSLGIDKLWRKKLVKEVGKYKPQRILDIATGTGDLAIALSKLSPSSIVGLDISVKMVEIGKEKVKAMGLSETIFLNEGDSENIAFDSNSFDFATVAFGVRNFENPQLGLNEMYRVLKPGGGIAVLEFAMPTKFPFKQLYKFYFFNILPSVGRLFSKDVSAYKYLPESVEAFPSGEKFTTLLQNAGFKKTRIIPLTFGVANIYLGEK